MSNFDKMLALFETKEFNLENLQKQYRKKALIYHPDKGGKGDDYKNLLSSYLLLLPLVEGTISEKELMDIREELSKSSSGTRKEILAQVKSVNANAFNFLISKQEWISINTNILNGDIFSKQNFNSMLNLSRSKYASFFTPIASKEELFSEIKNTITSSLKLFVYLYFSASVVDYILISSLFFGIPKIGHSEILVDLDELKDDQNSLSYITKVALYSTLIDSLFTLTNPAVNLLSLFIRSGVTLATAIDFNHDQNETCETPLALTAG